MLRIASRFGVQIAFEPRKCLGTCIRGITTAPSRTDSVEVPVGGGGNVQLDITYPTRRAQKQPAVLVNLPASSSILSSSIETPRSESLQSLVSGSFPSATLISINYRLGPRSAASAVAEHENIRFPQPIHDISIAFSHILEEIIPSLFSGQARSLSPWQANHTPRFALFGTHIGAALATMLALTQPTDIHSVAISNPLVDWVILDELLRPIRTSPGSPRAKRVSPAGPAEDQMFIRSAAKQLIDVRTKLFASPSAYFDPFASPTLFLRAPGRDTPRTHADALGMLDDEMTFDNETEIDEGWEAVGGKDDYSLSTQTPPPGAGKDDLENLNIDTNALSRNAASNEPSSVQQDLDTITEAIGADSFGPYDDDHHAKSDSSTPAATDTSRSNSNSSSLSHTGSKQPKRRKVLRRWPSISRPEDVMLPYFNVYVSPPPSPDLENSATRTDNGNVGLDAGMNALLRMQGIELADLLRRACFYDREKGVGEERVKLTEVGGDGDHVQDRGSRDAKAGEEQRTRAMVEWLRWRLESQ